METPATTPEATAGTSPVPAGTATMSNAEVADHLRDLLGADAVTDVRDEYGTFTLTVPVERYVDVVRALRDDRYLAHDMFDSLFGVDEREDGFSVVCVLYSTTRRARVLVRVAVPGGRENPVCPSVTPLYEGADWMERETWDMFGIDFEGHPQIAPRILSVENFEGWPLRKDFFLASRAAKPWPGVKEPAETDEDGNVIEKEPLIGEAPGPMPLDELMAEQARAANPRPDAKLDEAASSDAIVEGATDEAPDDKQTPAGEDPTPEAPEVPDAGQDGEGDA